MKSRIVFSSIITALSVTLLAGCGKSETEPQKPASTEPTSPGTSLGGITRDLSNTVTSAAQSTQAAAKDAGTQIQAAGQTALTDASAQAQGLLDKAKELISAQKLQEAGSVLQQLSTLKLTPEQSKLLADLKAKLQSALSAAGVTNAASALGNVLGGKK